MKCVSLSSNKRITFCRVPSLCGIGRNEKADLATKAALNLPYANLGILYTDLKYHINKYIISNWQDEWNDVGANKPRSVKPVFGEWQSSYRQSRKDEVIICRSHVGHTLLTHSFILAGTARLSVSTVPVHHICVRCPHLQPVTDDVFGSEGVMESF